MRLWKTAQLVEFVRGLGDAARSGRPLLGIDHGTSCIGISLSDST